MGGDLEGLAENDCTGVCIGDALVVVPVQEILKYNYQDEVYNSWWVKKFNH